MLGEEVCLVLENNSPLSGKGAILATSHAGFFEGMGVG